MNDEFDPYSPFADGPSWQQLRDRLTIFVMRRILRAFPEASDITIGVKIGNTSNTFMFSGNGLHEIRQRANKTGNDQDRV